MILVSQPFTSTFCPVDTLLDLVPVPDDLLPLVNISDSNALHAATRPPSPSPLLNSDDLSYYTNIELFRPDHRGKSKSTVPAVLWTLITSLYNTSLFSHCTRIKTTNTLFIIRLPSLLSSMRLSFTLTLIICHQHWPLLILILQIVHLMPLIKK